MKLFQPKSEEGNPNDPYMVNPRGAVVRVSEERVMELLKRGFVLEDRSWRPTKKERPVDRDTPIPLELLEQEVREEIDTLEVTEI